MCDAIRIASVFTTRVVFCSRCMEEHTWQGKLRTTMKQEMWVENGECRVRLYTSGGWVWCAGPCISGTSISGAGGGGGGCSGGVVNGRRGVVGRRCSR